jgi:UDP-N-acetylmuramoyl-tripeptide--D-alanyl-D-alanine ligase
LNEKAYLKATEVNLMEESIEFMLKKDNEKHKFKIDVPGEHSVLNSLLAIGCGVELGVSYDDISEGLKNLARTPMRLEIIRNKEGYVIINDCYNASPQSMKSALEVQNNIKCDKRIAVLGTMLELGDESYLAHKEIGEYAKAIKVDELLVTGDFSKAYKEGFGEDTKVFNTKLELIEYLKPNVSIGNSVLVKASRSMKFEEIVDAIK